MPLPRWRARPSPMGAGTTHAFICVRAQRQRRRKPDLMGSGGRPPGLSTAAQGRDSAAAVAKSLILKATVALAAAPSLQFPPPQKPAWTALAPPGSPMARITVEDCLEVVDNRFELVMMAAKRARQLANGVEPLLDNSEAQDKPTVLALREIAARRIDTDYIDAVEKAERERKEREALEWAAAEVVADDDMSKGDD